MKDIQVTISYTVTLEQINCEHDWSAEYHVCNNCLILKRTWYAIQDNKQYKQWRAIYAKDRQKNKEVERRKA